MNGQLVYNLLKPNQMIGDIGSGASGGHWWPKIEAGTKIDAFDLYHDTCSSNDWVTFHKRDVTTLKDDPVYASKYDLIVADHIFEHVEDPFGLAKSIDAITKPDGVVHIGIPAADNFTDIFYRLIHRHSSGGHIQKFKKNDMIELIESNGFKCTACEVWEDDWVWLEKCFSLVNNNVEGVTQDEIQYLVNTFRKEMTTDRGYVYGYEYIFERR